MKKINSLADLVHFKQVVETLLPNFPENIYVFSPEVIQDCIEYGGDTTVPKTLCDVQVYGIHVLSNLSSYVSSKELEDILTLIDLKIDNLRSVADRVNKHESWLQEIEYYQQIKYKLKRG